MKPTTMIELGRRAGAVDEKGQNLKAALATMNNRCAMIDAAAPDELRALGEDFERIQSLGAEMSQAARQAGTIVQRAMAEASAPVTRGDGVPAEPEPKATRERRPRKARDGTAATDTSEPPASPDAIAAPAHQADWTLPQAA